MTQSLFSRPTRRHLAVWCPQLPLDRWRRRDDPRLWGAFAVTERVANADRILVCNDHAADAGVRAGQSLSDARAVCPDILTELHEPALEARLLSALHAWSDRFSPLIGIDPPDGLALDVSGCAQLFGGEDQLATVLREGMAELSVVARVGIANTRLAARGFARFGKTPIRITEPEREHREVDHLPVEALELEPKTLETLRRLDVRIIGDLSAFKPAQLSRRFSVRVPDALDRLRGHKADPLVPSAAERVFSASRTLAEPVSHVEPVTHVLTALAEKVCRDLNQDGKAARSFVFTVRRVDAEPEVLRIGFARPSREVGSILRQFERPVSALRLPFGSDGFRLMAHDVELFAQTQADLESEAARVQDAVDQTLTTLGNRLGFDRLRRPLALSGHAPEDEHGSREITDAFEARDPEPHGALTLHPRPERIWEPEWIHVEIAGQPPRAFTWKGQLHRVARVSGRERVAPVWWRLHITPATGSTRDFWRVTTEDGRCLWVMGHMGQPDLGWFVCGEFLVAPCFELPSELVAHFQR